jgi:hypothetical protein
MKNILLLSLLGVGLMAAPSAKAAPVAFGIGVRVGPAYVGPAPVCTYGYYSYYPYACAPYGYYGPQWFSGGVFIGAGPWFHGFYGGHPGFYGRPGFNGYRGGPVARGPVFAGRAQVGTGFRGGYVHGGPARGAFHGR